MSPKSGKEPTIKRNWLKIEYIKGCPNILTSKWMVAEYRRRLQAAGKPVPDTFWCWFCGRPFKVSQAYRAHQRWCKKKAIYATTMRDGFRFKIGSRVVMVKTNRWSWLRAAEEAEAELNQRIAAGEIDQTGAEIRFNWYVLGHLDTWTRAEASEANPSTDPTTAAAGGG